MKKSLLKIISSSIPKRFSLPATKMHISSLGKPKNPMAGLQKLGFLTIIIAGLLILSGSIFPAPTQALPSDYSRLFNRNIRYYKPVEGPQNCGNSSNFSGSNNAQIAFNFFISKGLSPQQAAGIVGNLQLESGPGLDPKASNGSTIGIGQWLGGRKTNLMSFALAQNKDPLTLELQLEFLHKESNERKMRGDSKTIEWEGLKRTTSVEEATLYWEYNFERSGGAALERRLQYAQAIFTAYGGTPSTGTTSGSGGCPGGPGVGGIDVFPLKTTKAAIQVGAEGARWCFGKTTNCHHDYNAADIHASIGTPVVAAKSGKVVLMNDRVGGTGSNVVVLGDDGQFTYYYTHMGYGTIQVKEGDQVSTGQPVGAVGDSKQAMGTAPHVHYDMLPQAQYTNRPSCSGPRCSGYPFIDVQPLLKQLYETQVPD